MQNEGTRREPLSSASSPMAGTFVSQPVSTPRRYRMFSIVNVIAVVLVIAIIGATSLFLFRRFTTPTVDTSLPTQSAVTTSSQHCLLNLHTDDDGLNYVCKHHLYQSVQRIVHTGNYTVTIAQEYADMNRIALAYSVQEGKRDVTQGTPLEMSIVAGKSIVFENTFGEPVVANSGDASFYPTQPLSKLRILAVQLTVGLQGENSSAATTFSLPLHTEQHILSIHQQVVANGISVTFEGGNVSLSQANFSIVFSQDLLSIHAIVGPPTLTVNNNTIHCNFDGSGIHNTYNLQFPCPLFYEQGKWTLQVTAISMRNGSRLAPWTFTFDV